MAYTDIDDPTQFFNTKLYTGNGSTQTLTGIGFNADLIWLKNRTDSSTSHVLTDSVRTHAKYLKSNAIDSEGTYPFVTNRGSDGYDVASHSWSGASGKNYVAWNWLAGGSASSNSDGSITSSVSASTDAGFSIVGWTGTGSAATIGHGLGVAPKAIIIKQRTFADGWIVFFPTLDITLALHSTSANNHSSKFSGFFNSTDPTSTLISLGTDDQTNKSSETYIAYCFAEKKGYSKFGSYTGNGNADGAFVYTGFKPAFFICKRYNDSGYDWLMYDNKRQVSFNVIDDFLKPNLADAETTGNANQSLDFLSNGVKHRGNGASSNGSGASYIYMAFAESPFVNSNGVPNNAR